jgi:hypothetical protein
VYRWSDGRRVALNGQRIIYFFYEEVNGDPQFGTGFFVRKRNVSAVRLVEFISYRMSHVKLRGRWCSVIVLNEHAPYEDKSGDVKDSFYEELRLVFDQCPRYDLNILLGDFNAKVGREKSSN